MKPILFNTEMVQAILDGRKTQTRRLIKPQPAGDVPRTIGCHWLDDGYGYSDEEHDCKSPYRPGDTLWVRETWYYESHMHELTAGEPDLPSGNYSHRYIYKTDRPNYPVNVGVGKQGWRPSIHMPREAARLFLLVKSVRVERLQEITAKDARAEGHPPGRWVDFTEDPQAHDDAALDWFMDTWDSIYGKKHPWDSNPWVWVVEFERTELTIKGRINS